MQKLFRALDKFVKIIVDEHLIVDKVTLDYRKGLRQWLTVEVFSWGEDSPILEYLSEKADCDDSYSDFVLCIPEQLTHATKVIVEQGFSALTDHQLVMFSISPVVICDVKSTLALLLAPCETALAKIRRQRINCCAAILGIDGKKAIFTWRREIRALRGNVT